MNRYKDARPTAVSLVRLAAMQVLISLLISTEKSRAATTTVKIRGSGDLPVDCTLTVKMMRLRAHINVLKYRESNPQQHF